MLWLTGIYLFPFSVISDRSRSRLSPGQVKVKSRSATIPNHTKLIIMRSFKYFEKIPILLVFNISKFPCPMSDV